MIRRFMLKAAAACAFAVPVLAHAAAPIIEVFKSATCGCCSAWVKHLEANGFSVKAHNVPNPAAYRQKAGIPDALGSCHTAMVGGYAIEGHVPAADIKRLLTEKPKAQGLAVPGMPVGSPGMEGARADAYEVLLVKTDGRSTVYKRYH